MQKQNYIIFFLDTRSFNQYIDGVSQLGCLQKCLRSSRCQYCVTQRRNGDSIDTVWVVRSKVLSGLVSPILPISKLTLSLKKIKWNLKKKQKKPYRSLLIQRYAKDATRLLQPQPGSLQTAKGNHQDPHWLRLQIRLQKHTLKINPHLDFCKKRKKKKTYFFPPLFGRN